MTNTYKLTLLLVLSGIVIALEAKQAPVKAPIVQKTKAVKPAPVAAPIVEKELEEYYPEDYLNQTFESTEENGECFRDQTEAMPDEELEIEQDEVTPDVHSASIKQLSDLKQNKETDLETFNREVVKSTKPVVVKYTATWCGPCQQMVPAFSAAADNFADSVSFIEIDIDKCPTVAKKFKINSVPQMHFYKNGKKITEVGGGLTNPKQIIDQVKMHFKIK